MRKDTHPYYGTDLELKTKSIQRENYRDTVSEEEYNRRLNLFMTANHDKYLKETLMIGFMEKFPEVEGDLVDEITVESTCRRYDVKFKVRFGKVSFAEGKHTVDGITTDRVDISAKLPLAGFGSQCCYDEAETMEKAIVQMAMKHNLMICQKICSWPHAKAIVQPITQDFVRAFKE